jgi:hypothetical protein
MTMNHDAAAAAVEAGLRAGAECLEAALAYRRLGWSALCLCPPDHVGVGRGHGQTCPEKHWGKRPLGGGSRWSEYQRRLPTEDEIRGWWREHGNANVGVVLGSVSGLVRIDTEGALGEAKLLEVSKGDLPETLTFVSGRQGGEGRGRLYRTPPGAPAQTGVEGVEAGEGFRVQGDGAQTVMPPSRHRSGARYVWLPGCSPVEREAAPAPGWLLELLRLGNSRWRREAPADGAQIAEGCRNDTLTSMAGGMRRHGFGGEALYAALAAENAARCSPPLPDGEIQSIARSVARYEPDAYANAHVTVRVGRAQETGANGHATPATGFGPPIPSSMLRKVTDEARWLWKGYVSAGGITLLSALWKAGKTTLLAHMLKAFEGEGEFLGQTIRPTRVLYVTEEHESVWADRRDQIGFGDWVEFLPRPFACKPDMRRWTEFLNYLDEVREERGYGLIVFDTIGNLWPVRDENDAARMQECLMPLHSIMEGSALLLTHHLRKGDGTELTGTRGSGAFMAFVDTIVELRRFNPADQYDRRRVLTGAGRFPETPPDVVVELTEADGFHLCGSRADVRQRDLAAVIIGLLGDAPPGALWEEVYAVWPAEGKPAQGAFRKALQDGAEAGLWIREGSGRRNSPYRYRKPREDSPFE